MKILIAYDGSGYSRNSLDDLLCAGLPPKAEALILSVSEIWLPLKVGREEVEQLPDDDLAEYFKRQYEQIDRNAAEIEEVTREAQEKLRKNFPGWMIKTETVSGSPAPVILSSAIKFKSDLIVVGARGLSSDGIRGLGSIAQKVLTEAECSVRIARGKTDINRSRLKILIGFNGTPGAMAAVEAVASREWNGKPDIRLGVITDPLFPLIPGRAFQILPDWSVEKIKKGERKWAEILSAKALQTLRSSGLSASLFVCGGNPRMVLVREAAEWGADSIFVGANSFPYLLGCNASAIASRAHCSVEVIRKK